MPFEEKVTWVALVVAAIVPAVYFANVLPQLAHTPAASIAYQQPLIIAIVASILLTILGSIAVAIATAIPLEIMHEGSSKDLDRTDERDKHIGRRGELAGYYVSSAGAVIVLVMIMLSWPYFWLANVLYLSFVVASIVSSAVKLVAYRRGF